MLVTLIPYIFNAAPTEKNPAPPRIFPRNFTCRTIEQGLGFRVEGLNEVDVLVILFRRYEHRVTTLKTNSVPSIFILDF